MITTKRFLLSFALVTAVFMGCQKSVPKSHEQQCAEDERISIADSKYPEATKLFFEGKHLHEQGKWKESCAPLLKAYKISPDHTAGLTYYLFINYGMLGDVKNSKIWFNECSGQADPMEELGEDCANGKYQKLCQDKILLAQMKPE